MSNDLYGVAPARWYPDRWDTVRRIVADRLAGLTRPRPGPPAAAGEPLPPNQVHLVTALEAALIGMRGRGRAITASQPYEVGGVLAPLVVLGRTAADSVCWEVPDDLYAHGHADALAHVVLALLANAARHAPGRAVTVAAEPVGGFVRVSVANDVAEGAAGVPAPGVGLRVCGRMVVAEGGRMHVQPGVHGRWRVLLDLPAAA
ncbi:hypothetical protein GCM10010123_29030 [Pilimelia anulata]|uniref:Uncharacterized protein n=1 Tax=Pilimelia anulata TaxID=53371 RepID=A0A8J3B6J5_9ACTN|nr:ATP-binding protein [Pilimelia anulata]GGJ97236.1 hypothetical protein GCM10010123_29030 [Pilimelia anulata]